MQVFRGDTASENCFSEFGEPYKFTGKELDEETGLYYFGARYYDPVVSQWVSTDPPMMTGEYLPTGKQLFFPEDKFDHRSLPGIGGVYNTVNLNVYHYAGQNPVKFVDPNGKVLWDLVDVGMAGWSWKDFAENPTPGNFGWALVDTAAILPIVPSSGYARRGGKVLFENAAKKYSSNQLGKNLVKAGFKRGADQAAHHIVAGGSRFAEKSREILEKFGIGLDDAVNGVFLDKGIHSPMHNKEYYAKVEKMLSEAKTKQEVVKILEKIKDGLSKNNK